MKKFEEAFFPEEAMALLRKVNAEPDSVWRNDVYQVLIRKEPQKDGWPCGMLWLSIKRIDKEPVHDWRDMQAIKNELVGPEHEGIELFPAESRMVDGANQYHMWVLDQPGVQYPVGFNEGRVVHDGPSIFGEKQRPFEEE